MAQCNIHDMRGDHGSRVSWAGDEKEAKDCWSRIYIIRLVDGIASEWRNLFGNDIGKYRLGV